MSFNFKQNYLTLGKFIAISHYDYYNPIKYNNLNDNDRHIETKPAILT